MTTLNLLAAEPLIIARLESQLANITGLKVGSIATFVGLFEPAAHLPSLWVQPGEAKRGDARGGATVDVQQWIVHHFFKLVADKTGYDSTFVAAGTTLARAYAALAGWSPGAGLGPMRYSGRPTPIIDREKGYADILVAYEVDFILRT